MTSYTNMCLWDKRMSHRRWWSLKMEAGISSKTSLLFANRPYSDSLRAGRSGDPIPVGPRFSAAVQIGPGAYPATCTMGTGTYPRVKRPGACCRPPTPSMCRGHERVVLHLYSPSGPQWPVIGRTWRQIPEELSVNNTWCGFLHCQPLFIYLCFI